MSSDMFAALSAPFPADAVQWRPGSFTKDKTKAKALAYIDQRDVIDRLNEVCGAFGWRCRNIPMHNGTTCCEILIKDPDTGEWVEKSGGAGATGDVDNEEQREMAEKGGYSDALKRAGVLWGIGRYLYDISAPWVALNQWKQIEPDEMPKLRALLERNKAQPVSAFAARKTGEFPRLEAALRKCVSLDQLGTLWKAEQSVIAALPKSWQSKLTEEKDRIKALLSTQQLEAAE